MKQSFTQNISILKKAWSLFCTTRAMSTIYQKYHSLSSKYVYATSRGHEAVQIALGLHCGAQDYLFPYYRDDALLLTVGLQPKDLISQLLAKASDPYSMGRTYYAHCSVKQDSLPKIPHQSSGTGMQAIPATGAAMGIQYLEKLGLKKSDMSIDKNPIDKKSIVVCSLGDGALNEGEVSEALQYCELKQLPILFLIQNNNWSLSAKTEEIRGSDIKTFLSGVPGISYYHVDGSDFSQCYDVFESVINDMRINRTPVVIQADVPLLGDHTSSIPAKRYRDDLFLDGDDPFDNLKHALIMAGELPEDLEQICQNHEIDIEKIFLEVASDEEPNIASLDHYVFSNAKNSTLSPALISPLIPTSKKTAKAIPDNKQFMIEYGLLAMRDLMQKHPECLVYGQDVGGRLGGVFGATASLQQEFGSHRVFNMPIQEALTVGSTVGLSAVGCRPIVEIQFADYLWLGLNQLFSELSRSCYLTAGKWPVSAVIRVAIGAYDNHGPYHSSSIEAILTNIVGIKVVYPSCGRDLYGLIQSAYYDPNPVVILEHKAIYWAQGEHFELVNKPADRLENSVFENSTPIGKSSLVKIANSLSEKVCIITWGMGVHLSWQASKSFADEVEILDLRTLSPIDEQAIYASVRKCGRCMIVTEEPKNHSFAQTLAGRIQGHCFNDLVCAIEVIGALDIPAIPLNENLEKAALPDVDSIVQAIRLLLS